MPLDPDEIWAENTRLREALRLAHAEITFALCFKDLERVQRTMRWALEHMKAALVEQKSDVL